jgi:hypothetical protein
VGSVAVAPESGLRKIFSHLDAMIKAFLIQLAFKIGNFLLNPGGFFGVRFRFGQLAAQFKFLLIKILSEIGCGFEKTL